MLAWKANCNQCFFSFMRRKKGFTDGRHYGPRNPSFSSIQYCGFLFNPSQIWQGNVFTPDGIVKTKMIRRYKG